VCLAKDPRRRSTLREGHASQRWTCARSAHPLPASAVRAEWCTRWRERQQRIRCERCERQSSEALVGDSRGNAQPQYQRDQLTGVTIRRKGLITADPSRSLPSSEAKGSG
jgi:hypothetical protein